MGQCVKVRRKMQEIAQKNLQKSGNFCRVTTKAMRESHENLRKENKCGRATNRTNWHESSRMNAWFRAKRPRSQWRQEKKLRTFLFLGALRPLAVLAQCLRFPFVKIRVNSCDSWLSRFPAAAQNLPRSMHPSNLSLMGAFFDPTAFLGLLLMLIGGGVRDLASCLSTDAYWK